MGSLKDICILRAEEWLYLLTEPVGFAAVGFGRRQGFLHIGRGEERPVHEWLRSRPCSAANLETQQIVSPTEWTNSKF